MATAGTSTPQLEAWYALLRAHAALTECLEAELLAKHGLPLSWFAVLLDLSKAADGRMRLYDFRACTQMTKSGITRLVDRMEAEGLLARVGCADDHRGAWAVLTDAGRERITAASPTHLQSIERHFGDRLTVNQAQQLQRSLQSVTEFCTESRAADNGEAG